MIGTSPNRSVPLPVVAIAMSTVAFFALPFVALVIRAPWSDAWGLLSSGGATTALRLSLWTSSVATAVSLLFGVPLAWTLAESRCRATSIVRALCTLSMVLPPVVGGVALLFALGRRGVLGRHLDRWFDIQLPFTTAATVIAQAFVAMPFLVVTVEAALRQRDRLPEEAARTLGAGEWTVFRLVTLPAVRPAIAAGGVLAWARALGEFGATVTFAGSFPGVTRTMPLEIYSLLDTDPSGAVILSLMMVGVSFVVLVALRRQWLPTIGERSQGRRTRPSKRQEHQ